VGLLVNPNNPRLTQDIIKGTEAGARQLGLDVVVLKAGTSDEIESAISAAVQQFFHVLGIKPAVASLSQNCNYTFAAHYREGYEGSGVDLQSQHGRCVLSDFYGLGLQSRVAGAE
jgi:hypothetical protein